MTEIHSIRLTEHERMALLYLVDVTHRLAIVTFMVTDKLATVDKVSCIIRTVDEMRELEWVFKNGMDTSLFYLTRVQSAGLGYLLKNLDKDVKELMPEEMKKILLGEGQKVMLEKLFVPEITETSKESLS